MSLEELPTELLELIFSSNDSFKDLVNFSKVCRRWNQIINCRFCKVTHILKNNFSPRRAIQVSCVYFDSFSEVNLMDLKLYFPKLKVLDLSGSNLRFDLAECLFSNQLKGVMFPCLINANLICTKGIEMIALNRSVQLKGPNLMQAYLSEFRFESLKQLLSDAPKLDRLHINVIQGLTLALKKFSNSRVKVLEFNLQVPDPCAIYPGFRLANQFVAVESVYLSCRYKYCNAVFNMTKNLLLKNLVIDYTNLQGCSFTPFPSTGLSQAWEILKRFFWHYPALVNVAIRNNSEICNEDLIELIEMLPELAVLDVRGCTYITINATEINRNIQIIRGPLTETFTVDVNFGNDLIKSYFEKQFESLPIFVD